MTDGRAELIRELRRLAAAHGLTPAVSTYHASGLTITPQAVVHTSHPAYGYLIEASGTRTAWAPEFLEFPSWAAGADLMFAEAAGWVHRSASPRAPEGTRQHWTWRNRPPGMAYGTWCSPTSAGPPSPRWTPGSSRHSARSEQKVPSTPSAAAQAAATDGPSVSRRPAGTGSSRAADGGGDVTAAGRAGRRRGRSALMAGEAGERCWHEPHPLRVS